MSDFYDVFFFGLVVFVRLGGTKVLLALAKDGKSFVSYSNHDRGLARVNQDTILIGAKHFRLNGKGIDTAYVLKPIAAYQEFWHSLRHFKQGIAKF